jgi:hypothetical protein
MNNLPESTFAIGPQLAETLLAPPLSVDEIDLLILRAQAEEDAARVADVAAGGLGYPVRADRLRNLRHDLANARHQLELARLEMR